MANRIDSYIPFFLGLVSAIGVIVGVKLQSTLLEDQYISPIHSENEAIYEAMQHINEKFYGDIDTVSFTDEVVSSMISELDEYSKYWDLERNGFYHQYLNGTYLGRGFELMKIDSNYFITNVLKGSPSELAKLKKRDQIINIGQISIGNLSIDSVQNLLLSKDTSSISIYRSTDEEFFQCTLVASEVTIPHVLSYVIEDGGEVYIAINRFSSDVFKSFMEELEVHKKNGIDIKDLIIDLRNNPGGLLEETVKLLNQLIEEPNVVMVSTIDNKGRRTEYKSNGRNFLDVERIVVLINKNSASASEILAGSLQDLDRAIVVGEHSFGKGMIQQNYRLSNGASISLTTGEYLLPSGRTISKSRDTSSTFQTQYLKRNINVDYGVSPEMKIQKLECSDYLNKREQEKEFLRFMIDKGYMEKQNVTTSQIETLSAELLRENEELTKCDDLKLRDFKYFALNFLIDSIENVPSAFMDHEIAFAIEILRKGEYDKILK